MIAEPSIYSCKILNGTCSCSSSSTIPTTAISHTKRYAAFKLWYPVYSGFGSLAYQKYQSLKCYCNVH